MERPLTSPLDDAPQRVLDDLYWNTNTTMRVMAAQLGIVSKHASRL